uniref:Uncharacterized protein n=1 Tax=Cacopsylla melanoneura TaxID=428564 RepID=A0A8D8TRB0_9HEMI
MYWKYIVLEESEAPSNYSLYSLCVRKLICAFTLLKCGVNLKVANLKKRKKKKVSGEFITTTANCYTLGLLGLFFSFSEFINSDANLYFSRHTNESPRKCSFSLSKFQFR